MFAGKILVCLLSVAAEPTPSTTSRCIRWLLSMLILMEIFDMYDVANYFLLCLLLCSSYDSFVENV